MADPTETEVQTMISNVAALYVAARGWGSADSPNLLGMIDTVEQSLEGDYIDEVIAGLRGIRGAFAGTLGAVRPVLDGLWRTYGKAQNFPEGSPLGILNRLYTYMHENSEYVNSREFTFGSVSAGGSNVGDGTILRLTKDRYDYDTEAVTPDTKTFQVIEDEHSGARREHEELFEVRAQHEDRDGIAITGSGLTGTIRAVSANDSKRYIQNPSFDDLDGDAVDDLDSIPGWTVGSAVASFNLSSTTYRDILNSGNRSLKFLGNDCVEQNLNNLNFRNPTIRGVIAPMHLQIAYQRESSCDGTLTLRLGNETAAVALSAQSGWNALKIGPGDENWFDTWNKENPLIKISLVGRTTGTLLVDDVIFAPFQPIDGCWWLPVGGATPFLRDDKFTFADSISSDSKIQRTIAELYGVYLPHATGGGETWSDPA